MKANNITIGILAHVDAGKTTLSEAMLFASGAIRSQGRVDRGDAFLDTDPMEKDRGITIFAKQARFTYEKKNFTLLDTPGHADFSPETERTLQVLDAAILVISAPDGITGQVRTLWKLLSHYHVPTFIFVNKMDQPGMDPQASINALREGLSHHILDFTKLSSTEQLSALKESTLLEDIAVCEEALTENYLNGILPEISDVRRLIQSRKLFPCFLGSALKSMGIRELLSGIAAWIPEKDYPDTFAARVFKITRDNEGKRLTHMKVLGGSLQARTPIAYESATGEALEEKVDQLRLYSGTKFQTVTEVLAGEICAVTGLSRMAIGTPLGDLEAESEELLSPILRCRLLLTDDADPFLVYRNLKLLEEEEPILRAEQTASGSIYVHVMGSVQMEILQRLMNDRFGISIDYGESEIVYKETIASPVLGIGHFEPLRHYAEVQLLIEPLPPGNGIQYDSTCSTDRLTRNWQHLVLSSLEAKEHLGVLTGSPLTDVKITLRTGRSHPKHTEGGDFREASLRAVRQGLMQAENILLEPILQITLTIPASAIGRAMNDLSRMHGEMQPADIQGEHAIITGAVPAACLGNYAEEVIAYTHGDGSLSSSLLGYRPCHNTQEVLEKIGYDPERDIENPSSSVFVEHGVGTIIPWDQVPERAHLEIESLVKNKDEDVLDPVNLSGQLLEEYRSGTIETFRGRDERYTSDTRSYEERESAYQATQKELDDIFRRTYGEVKVRYSSREDRSRDFDAPAKDPSAPKGGDPKYQKKPQAPVQEYLLVDGYNVLYASEELHDLAVSDLKAARDALADILSDFQGTRRESVILVFDAYKVSGGKEHVDNYHNITVVYTREAETADQYIEKAAKALGEKHRVTVATSDAIEQMIIYGSGARRLSARDFWEEIRRTRQALRDRYLTE